MKSERDLVSQRYAKALIDMVFTEGTAPEVADKVLADLNTINMTVAENSELRLLLNHPAYSVTQKTSLLQDIFGAPVQKIQEITIRLLDLLVSRRRLDILPAIENQFRQLLNERRDIVSAELVSSEALSEKNLADIKARLSEDLGKKIHLDVAVDPSLIAGYVLRMKDQVIDGSLKGKLTAIEKVLLSV